MRWIFAIFALPALMSAAPGNSGAADRLEETAYYRFEYRVSIPATGSEEEVSLWVPYPIEDEYQEVVKHEILSSLPWKIGREVKYGNRFIHLRGRTGGQPSEAVFRYEIRRRPSSGYPREWLSKRPDLNPDLHRSAERLVPLHDLIRRMSEEATQGLSADSDKIRALYRYVYDAMTYSKEGTGWGEGDAVWACHNKRGNCTDFHSLLIAMARAQGIPARFVIGFPIAPDLPEGVISGYHCWAELYDPSRGWIPVDASESKKARQPDKFFGRLPSDRIAFSVGRDLYLEPRQAGDALNYFIYPYAERSGRTLEGVGRAFRFERIPEPNPATRNVWFGGATHTSSKIRPPKDPRRRSSPACIPPGHISTGPCRSRSA
ncbi:MAG: transglutaminase domain-containing protein [Deltaproteobacteria bacterium]|nr:transglutaminase domain-containing protein [Deltaproteobacteria bacterium]